MFNVDNPVNLGGCLGVNSAETGRFLKARISLQAFGAKQFETYIKEKPIC
jgi:hypothetical protein